MIKSNNINNCLKILIKNNADTEVRISIGEEFNQRRSP